MENELSQIVDTLPGLIWAALPDGYVDYLNQGWRHYTGFTFAEACGQGWQTAIHPEDRPELIKRWESILSSGEPGEMEARLRRFDGMYRWFLFRINPVANPSGQLIKWCGINIDIEDRRRAKEVLAASERRFRWIVDGLPALITLRTPDGDLEFANRTIWNISARRSKK